MEVSQPLDHVTHAVIGGSKTIDFGISNSADFFDILSRTLYKDQILAVVREVLCNAWDAHIAAGCTDKPIQILLDSEHFVVRDFGYGISHADIGPIYGVYGASTKKNDGLQTGGFGLGCKAPFAYTDHFEVISHHNKMKTIYNMSKSNAVAKGKPGIITLAQLPTTESGLRVKIPVQTKDWPRFIELIKRIVSNGEMNATLNDELLPTIPFSQAVNGYFLTTKLVMGNQDRWKILLRYGNVIYPIESNDELSKLYTDVGHVLKRLEDYHLVLQAPPDSISVTPSREALSMQEHTIKTLTRLFKNFLSQVKTLNEEVLIQGKTLTQNEVVQKNYDALFSTSWGFTQTSQSVYTDIIDLAGIARNQLTRSYPADPIFRVRDVNQRVQEAAKAKIVDPYLAASFLEKLPEVKDLPCRYYYAVRKSCSDWLHRNVLSKVAVKLQKAGMDISGLAIIDRMQPRTTNRDCDLVPLKLIFGRNHLLNLPFLRKVVVVTTAITNLSDRISEYKRYHPATPIDGVLVYHIRSRKAGNAETVLEVFVKLGYEIIDLTKRQPWEVEDTRPAMPRKKPEPYPGLPALNNLVDPHSTNLDIQRYRIDTAVKLPTPELVLIIGARANNAHTIDGFLPNATKALIKLYGDRLGIAKDLIEYKRAIKYGAKDFLPVLEAEMQDMLFNSPTVAEYLAYDFIRVKKDVMSYRSDIEALGLMYRDADLRREFGLKNNLTDMEKAMLAAFYHSKGLSEVCKLLINNFIATIPLGPENALAVAAVTSNDLLDMLSISNVRQGFKTAKRQIYYDVLLKVLKG